MKRFYFPFHSTICYLVFLLLKILKCLLTPAKVAQLLLINGYNKSLSNKLHIKMCEINAKSNSMSLSVFAKTPSSFLDYSPRYEKFANILHSLNSHFFIKAGFLVCNNFHLIPPGYFHWKILWKSTKAKKNAKSASPRVYHWISSLKRNVIYSQTN